MVQGGSSNVENGSYAQKVVYYQADDGGRRCDEGRDIWWTGRGGSWGEEFGRVGAKVYQPRKPF